jgi:hypothetical protein
VEVLKGAVQGCSVSLFPRRRGVAGSSPPGRVCGLRWDAGGATTVEFVEDHNDKPNPDDYKHLAAYYPQVDERDGKVADNWVKRHPSMIRLTGVHPFNSEPPLPELIDHGFISPVNLHIVRDHGAVPKIKWQEHKRACPASACRPRAHWLGSSRPYIMRLPGHSLL